MWEYMMFCRSVWLCVCTAASQYPGMRAMAWGAGGWAAASRCVRGAGFAVTAATVGPTCVPSGTATEVANVCAVVLALAELTAEVALASNSGAGLELVPNQCL